MKATLSDVAREAGVSRSLVSKCLAGAPDARMREETRRRIEEAVRKCRYLPSRLAQSLKQGRSRTIGLVISDLRNPFWSLFADFALRETKRHGYRLLISLCDFNREEELEHLRALLEYRVDGILYCEHLGENDLAEQLRKEQFPIMLMFQESPSFPAARVDYSSALADAVKELARRGCRELFCIRCGESAWSRILRRECRSAGLDFSVRSAPRKPEALIPFLDRICREAPPAIVLNGWRTGLLLLRRIEALFPEYRPEFILNSHFDHPEFLNPRITGIVRTDLELLVRRSVESLIGRIRGECASGDPLLFPAAFLSAADFRKLARNNLLRDFPY